MQTDLPGVLRLIFVDQVHQKEPNKRTSTLMSSHFYMQKKQTNNILREWHTHM